MSQKVYSSTVLAPTTYLAVPPQTANVSTAASQHPTPPENLMLNQYQILDKIGSGTFGAVYKCLDITTQEIVAVKKMKKHYESEEEAFNIREVKVLRRLMELGKHPNIIDTKRIEYDNGTLYIVLEHCDMNLTEFMKEKLRKEQRRLTEEEVRIIMKQVLIAIDYFHQRGFLHRDIKPENFVINRDSYTVKMIDFGTSRDVSNVKPPYTAYVSTRWYRAPECALRTYYYGPASDIWAIGCVMAELFLGMPIFPGSSELNQIDTIFKILGTASKNQWREGYDLAAKRNYQFNFHKKIPLKFLFDELSQECVDMMEAMFIINPVIRPLAFELLKEPYFKNCNLVPPRVTHGNLNFGVPSQVHSPVVDKKTQKPNRLQSDERPQKQPDQQLAPQSFLQVRRSSLQSGGGHHQTQVTNQQRQDMPLQSSGSSRKRTSNEFQLLNVLSSNLPTTKGYLGGEASHHVSQASLVQEGLLATTAGPEYQTQVPKRRLLSSKKQVISDELNKWTKSFRMRRESDSQMTQINNQHRKTVMVGGLNGTVMSNARQILDSESERQAILAKIQQQVQATQKAKQSSKVQAQLKFHHKRPSVVQSGQESLLDNNNSFNQIIAQAFNPNLQQSLDKGSRFTRKRGSHPDWLQDFHNVLQLSPLRIQGQSTHNNRGSQVNIQQHLQAFFKQQQQQQQQSIAQVPTRHPSTTKKQVPLQKKTNAPFERKNSNESRVSLNPSIQNPPSAGYSALGKTFMKVSKKAAAVKNVTLY